jgi:glycosyltransferase involved in cell wall biosynthesis
MPEVLGQTSYDARQVSFAFADIEESGFDLVHDHSGFVGIAFSRYLATPMVHTVHCAFDTAAYGFYEQFAGEVPYIGISEYQQSMGPPAMNWAGLAYNAIAVEQWPYTPEKDDYLLAFGRVCEAKGFHLSIEAAKRTGRRLIMAGVLQEPYREYFEQKVAPHIDGDQIVYEGEVSDARKRELFTHAHAFVFPITWPEPFGLVMIEAMACGTPVVALRQGSVPEVLDDGVTGFVRDDFEEFVAAVGRVSEIDPAVCRRTVEERFTVARMVADYEAIYRRVLGA